MYAERDSGVAVLYICPSVTLRCCVSKRLNISMKFLHRLVAPSVNWTDRFVAYCRPTSGDMFSIGSTSLTGSDSDCASRCSNVSTAWLLDTWPSSADLSLASTDSGDQLAVASLTFHEFDCQHTKDARSVMLDRLLGTLFLSVSTTMHCLCLTLEISSNISASRPTSTPSAFRF